MPHAPGPTRRILALAALGVALALPQAAPDAAPRHGVGEQAAAAGTARMAAHRAAYRLDLGEARGSGITSVRGAMVFDITDACEGWATRQRMTMTVVDRDGNEIETISDYATYEAKDGTRLRFSLTQSTQARQPAHLRRGRAEGRRQRPRPLREPAGRERSCPRHHPADAPHRAVAGSRPCRQRLLAAPLFDARRRGAQDTTTISWRLDAPVGAAALRDAGRQASAACASPSSSAGRRRRRSSPEYEVGLRYYENVRRRRADDGFRRILGQRPHAGADAAARRLLRRGGARAQS